MKIVVLGDSYMPVDVFRSGFDRLAGRFELDFVQLEDDPGWTPSTDSERSLRECFGRPGDVRASVRGCDVIVVHGAPITEETLAAAPTVRLIACARGGPVNVDVQSATDRAVIVVTTPGKNADAVADLALAFMVMLARRVPEALRAVADGAPLGASAFEGGSYMGHDLGRHTLGVVGFGHVGRRVALRALAFGMRVLAFDPYVDVKVVEEAAASFVPMQQLLRESDFVSLHARATPDNANLMGRAQFASMKPGAYFVNTSRETLVDESALREALESGLLAGAALDVVRPPAGDGRHSLLDAPNVILTPHIGGSTHETLARGAEMLAAEVERFAKGQPLNHAVNAASVELARLDRHS